MHRLLQGKQVVPMNVLEPLLASLIPIVRVFERLVDGNTQVVTCVLQLVADVFRQATVGSAVVVELPPTKSLVVVARKLFRQCSNQRGLQHFDLDLDLDPPLTLLIGKRDSTLLSRRGPKLTTT